MKQRPAGRPSSSEQIIRDIKRKTGKQYNAEEKIRIVLDGLRGEDSCADEKALPKVFITSGPRTLWKPARSAWPVILFGKPIQVRSLTCGVKPEISKRWLPNKH